jgi:glycosyltransferase involved in cell wall biosynthesis
MARVTVVIPCFNHGQYVDEAVESVLKQTFQDFEIVIVDDGSTDPATIALLLQYERRNTRVIRTDNHGPSSARNLAIAAGSGEYILPLDADDRIADTYLEKAVRLMDEDPNLGIVYCEAEYFGDLSGRWPLPAFSMPEMIFKNMIFCSALFRRTAWAAVGGFRRDMDLACEDWDFWLGLLENGSEVHRIAEPLFFYRIAGPSRTSNLLKDPFGMDKIYRQLVVGHVALYVQHISDVYDRRQMFQEREYLAVRIALAALVRPLPLPGFLKRAATATGLLAWALPRLLSPMIGGRAY